MMSAVVLGLIGACAGVLWSPVAFWVAVLWFSAALWIVLGFSDFWIVLWISVVFWNVLGISVVFSIVFG